MPRVQTIPGYRLHKQSGQAYVFLNGRQHLLGEHGSAESKSKYARLIAEWSAVSADGRSDLKDVPNRSVAEVLIVFYRHAQAYYLNADGSPSAEQATVGSVIALTRHLYGDLPATEFGPKKLAALREAMIKPLEWTDPDSGKVYKHSAWCRTYANHQVNRVRHIFKWAAAQELVSASIYHALQTVQGLRRGKTEARESDRVKPASDAMVLQVLPFLPGPICAMVELEAITGARGGELCIMRGCDLDTSNADVWIYRPSTHKTAHHGHDREVPLGKKCQEIIRPFLKPSPTAFLFSPAEAESTRRAKILRLKTPAGQGNEVGTNKSKSPKRPPGERYNRNTYARAVSRACDAAFPPPEELARGRQKTGPERTRKETKAEWRERIGEDSWTALLAWRKSHRFSPHRLRHSAATKLRKLFGLEAAGVVLGQKTMAATMIYAEQDRELAAKVMGEIG